jgi:peptidoglycan/xylan/chitin deacetylase (PgdA/CDA1 family)
MTITALAAALRGEQALPERPVAVTFDDGYSDTYEAVEALCEQGLTATIYVTAGRIGDEGRLSAEQIEALAAAEDVEIGAHGIGHHPLDEVTDSELRDEIGGSRHLLEQLTGHGVRSFAYPHGAYDRRVRAAVIRAGYSSAAAVKNAVSHPDDDPFAIARFTVTDAASPERIADVLEGVRVPLAWPGERVRTRAYRLARRLRREVRGV